jgi:glycosyltransferase involved in cell wall biosynthesis
MTLTTIFPAFNNEISIGTLVLIAKKYTKSVIVVDDGSTDRTAEMAELAGAEVIRHRNRLGNGAALKSCFEYMEGKDAKVIVAINPDFQYDSEDIPRLIAPILSGEADIVKGCRHVNGNRKKTSFHRHMGKDRLDKVFNFETGFPITNKQSGILVFAKHTLSALRFKSNRNNTGSEVLMDAGLKIKDVEIGVKYNMDNSSEHSIAHGLRMLVNVLPDMELNRPFYYFIAPGLVFAIAGISLELNFLRDFYNGDYLNLGPTLLMTLLTLIGSFMAFTGIILHSMARVINESKIVKEVNKRGVA